MTKIFSTKMFSTKMLPVLLVVLSLDLGWSDPRLSLTQPFFIQSAAASDVILGNGKHVSAEAWQLYAQARTYLEAKNDKDAEAYLRKVLELEPGFTSARFNLGIMLYYQRKYKESAELFKTVTQEDPNNAGAWNMLGITSRESGDLEMAQTAIEQYIKLAPNDPKAQQLKAILVEVKDELKYRKQHGVSGVANSAGQNAKVLPDNYLAEINKGAGHCWQVAQMPIRIFIRPGASVEGFKPQYETFLLQAFQAWSNATGGRLQFVQVPEEKAAQLVCWFTSNRPKDTNTEMGHTNVTWRTDKTGEYIVRGQMEIYTKAGEGGAPITDGLILHVCLHEVGHSLGLHGHSRVSTDIMYPSSIANNPSPSLTQRDVNTVNLLYGFKGK